MRRTLYIAILIICSIAAVALLFKASSGFYYAAVLLLIVGFAAAAFGYERRLRPAPELVLTALFCALAVMGRAAFFYVPSLKAITAVIIIAGALLGAGNGFIVGVCSGFISNFIFGQGPWTPWQMLCWGLIGLLAGKLFFGRQAKRGLVCLYGGLSVFGLFGAVMNPVSLLTVQAYAGKEAIIAAYIAGLPFDAVHSLSTVIFLYLLYEPLRHKLARLKGKYGLFVEAGSRRD